LKLVRSAQDDVYLHKQMKSLRPNKSS
jgi:hypothetical protein